MGADQRILNDFKKYRLFPPSYDLASPSPLPPPPLVVTREYARSATHRKKKTEEGGGKESNHMTASKSDPL